MKDDIDYQADSHTVTMRFFGFESSLHGIMAFDWAIGTSPGAEDVQPFLEDGIIHEEEEDVAGNGNDVRFKSSKLNVRKILSKHYLLITFFPVNNDSLFNIQNTSVRGVKLIKRKRVSEYE